MFLYVSMLNNKYLSQPHMFALLVVSKFCIEKAATSAVNRLPSVHCAHGIILALGCIFQAAMTN